MPISSGHLDSLLNMNFGVQTLADLTYASGSASGSAVNSVTAKTAGTTYGTFDSLKVTSINDANNTIVVTGYSTTTGYYGGSTTTAVPWYFTVIGQTGNDLLLAANGAAALTSVPASTVASYIEQGNSATLSNDLFVFAIDNTDVASGQNLTFASLVPGTETVSALIASPPSTPAAVTDSAANVQGSLDALQGLAAKISGITLTDQGTPVLTVGAAQVTNDSAVLAKISGTYSLSVTDSAANVLAALDGLQSQVAAGHGLTVALTDQGTINLSVSPTQLAADSGALKDITSSYILTVDGSAANITAAGIAGHGTVVKFTGSAAQYTVTPAGDGTSFTVTDNGTGRSSTDHLSNITALSFGGTQDFVATTPGGANSITSGNITELYGAVFGRLPDVSGLAFYQSFLQAHPTVGLTTYATFFLSSGEYTGNPAHAYAQTSAGESQFVSDSYQNLLHRTAAASEVSFYTNVITPYLANLTPGTAAYAAADVQAHALVLTYFSQSPEFLTDVQITSAHPADSSHWLYLI